MAAFSLWQLLNQRQPFGDDGSTADNSVSRGNAWLAVPSVVPQYQPADDPYGLLSGSYLDGRQQGSWPSSPQVTGSYYRLPLDIGLGDPGSSSTSSFTPSGGAQALSGHGADDSPVPGEASGINLPGGVDQVGKKSRTQWCVNCGGPGAGTFGPYCQWCYLKSLDPKGGVPPLLEIIKKDLDVLKKD